VVRVVVVDDEALVRSGFELSIRETCPDVVLLKCRMPDVDALTGLGELDRHGAGSVG
jgi:YesN/AraC family two-component response regulator